MKDYYYILGISETASIEEIKTAYRKLAVKFHPDKNDGDEFFANRFKEINDAYEILGSHIKKSSYDQERLNKINGSSNFTPEIEFFRTSKNEIEFNEEVTFYWKTLNADKVTLRPFGIVQASGQKTYKIKDFKNNELSFDLIAENTNIDRKVKSIIKLKNNTYSELYQNIKSKIENEASISKKNTKIKRWQTISLIILFLLFIAFIIEPDFIRHLGYLFFNIRYRYF